MVTQKMALQSLWKGICNVYTNTGATDLITKRTKFTETKIISSQPCKLSFESLKINIESNHASEVVQSAKLFVSPDVIIPPGSKIEVTQNGKTAFYEMSGQPGIFTCHQEIPLILFKGFA